MGDWGQLFHFNGAAPATSYTRILTNVEIDQTRAEIGHFT
jgi:hypothetical protein